MSGSLKVGGSELINDSGGSGSLNWGSGVPSGSVIEQFMSPCDGSSITVQSGTYTVQNVTAKQDLTNTYSDVTGSVIDYTPPTGTQTVLYTFTFFSTWVDSSNPHNLAHYRLYLDNDSGTETEVTNFRTTLGSQQFSAGRHSLNWAFHIGGSDNDATGRRDTWTSARTIKLKAREYGSGNQTQLFETKHWDAAESAVFSQPLIGITALA